MLDHDERPRAGQRLTLILVAVVALTMSGCGNDQGPGPAGATTSSTAGGPGTTAAAAKDDQLLQLADLPAGWKDKSSANFSNAGQDCPAPDPLLAIPPPTKSEVGFNGSGAQALEAIGRYPSAEDAQRAVAAFLDANRRCAATSTGPVKIAEQPAPTGVDDGATFRYSTDMINSTLTVVRKGATVAAIATIGAPQDVSDQVATKAVARLR